MKRTLVGGSQLSSSSLLACVTQEIFLSLTGTRSPQCSAAAARRTWRPVLKKASGCVCSTCPRSRCSTVVKNVATAMWRRERSVTVESLRWECYKSRKRKLFYHLQFVSILALCPFCQNWISVLTATHKSLLIVFIWIRSRGTSVAFCSFPDRSTAQTSISQSKSKHLTSVSKQTAHSSRNSNTVLRKWA